MRFGDDQGPSCGGIRSSVGVNMAEEPDSWIDSVVRTLRGLFPNGQTPPRVAIVVAVEHEPRATSLPSTPDRVTSTSGAQSSGSWDQVPEVIQMVLPRGDLPTVVPASEYDELDDDGFTGLARVDDDGGHPLGDVCRRCGAGIIHRPGDAPRFWCTKWGKRYHVDRNCYGLRSADRKFPLHCLNDKPTLTPCKICV